MTCIVGIEHDGKVYIGGDSAGSDGHRLMIMAEPKVFHRGDFVIGYTWSFRMGQLLQHTLKAPAWAAADDRTSVHSFMVRKFMPAVRRCLAAGGWLTVKEEQDRGGQFLVGYRGELYVVESDMQIGRVRDGYYAVGSGADLALGSLHTTDCHESHKHLEDVDSTLDRIRLALKAAEHHAAGVAGPFTIEVTP